MWEWSSFASGVVGAILGAGITLLTTLVGRVDARTTARRAAIDDLNSALGQLIKPEFASSATAISDAHLAVTRLERHFRRGESPIADWLLLMLGAIATQDSVVIRTSMVGTVAIKLNQWEKREISESWFAAEWERSGEPT